MRANTGGASTRKDAVRPFGGLAFYLLHRIA